MHFKRGNLDLKMHNDIDSVWAYSETSLCFPLKSTTDTF